MFAWDRITQTYRCPRWVIAAMDVFILILAAAACAFLVLYHGFAAPSEKRNLLEAGGWAIVILFVADRLGRLAMAIRRREYLRENWADYVLIVLAGLLLAAKWEYGIGVISAGAIYIFITQAYLVVSLIPRALDRNLQQAGRMAKPILLFVCSFAAISFCGAGLLMLPAAIASNYEAWHFPDAMFTAVSAACLTGLTVADTAGRFTPLGQAVILVLIQCGGILIMLFGTILAMKACKVMSPAMADDLLLTTDAGNDGPAGKAGFYIVLTALILEGVGAILLYPVFSAPQGAAGIEQAPSTAKAVWDSVFHSVSAFCNAGFSTYDDNMMTGAKGSRAVWSHPLRNYWQMLGVLAPLIILGGLGYPVLRDIGRYFKKVIGRYFKPNGEKNADSARPVLSLHSNLVIMTSLILILLGAVVFMLVEPGRVAARTSEGNMRSDPQTAWMQMNTSEKLQAAYFQSISVRSAGFNTMDCAPLSNASKFWLSFLMITGASPAGTGGGMKTTTLAILLLMIWSALRGRNEAEAYNCSIPQDSVRQATVLGLAYLLVAAVLTLAMSAILPKDSTVDIIFESCSALGNSGLSTGISMRLETTGKFVMTAAMFVGRVGPVILAFVLAGRSEWTKSSLPSRGVLIG